MGLGDTMERHATSVFLNTEHHAVSATQIRSDATQDTIVVVPHCQEPKVMVRDGSSQTVHPAQLDVPASATLAKSDRWTFGGYTWECMAIGDSDAGIIPVMVERREVESESIDEEIVI